jgi:hypothetical protein
MVDVVEVLAIEVPGLPDHGVGFKTEVDLRVAFGAIKARGRAPFVGYSAVPIANPD